MEKSFNINKAATLARLSEVAYKVDPVGLTLDVRSLGYELVSPLNNGNTDTQGFVAKNVQHAVVVFRGTGSLLDAATDGQIRLIDGKHEGFLNALTSVEDQLKLALKKVHNLPIVSSGHSLGGALAKMALLQYPKLNWESCYTYGSPPICIENTKLQTDAPIFRIMQEGDIVPRSLDLNDVFYETVLATLKYVIGDETKSDPLSTAYKYIKSTWPELKKYSHLGYERIYTREGLFLENANSIEVLNKIFNTDYKRMIDDHSIVGYINSLERVAKNNITQC